MSSKSKKTDDPTHLRWTGDPSWIPGWGHLDRDRIYLAQDLPEGARGNPNFQPATVKQYESQAKSAANASEKESEE